MTMHGTGARPPGRKKRVGAGLSLEKFARGRRSAYDRREVLEKHRQAQTQRHSKYQRLKKRLDRDGKLLPQVPLAAAAAAPAAARGQPEQVRPGPGVVRGAAGSAWRRRVAVQPGVKRGVL